MATVPAEYKNDAEEQFYLALQDREAKTPWWFKETKCPKPSQRGKVDAFIYIEPMDDAPPIKVPFKIFEDALQQKEYLSTAIDLVRTHMLCFLVEDKSPREIRAEIYEILKSIRGARKRYDRFFSALFGGSAF